MIVTELPGLSTLMRMRVRLLELSEIQFAKFDYSQKNKQKSGQVKKLKACKKT